MALEPQPTDPWDLAFNKQLEFTVSGTIAVGGANVIDLADVYTNLRAQQPLFGNIPTTTNIHIRLIAITCWGPGGGGVSMAPAQIGRAASGNPRVQRVDIGDGIKRPVVSYTWTPLEQDTWMEVDGISSTDKVATVQVTPGVGSDGRGIFYIKCHIKSTAFVSLAVTQQLTKDKRDVSEIEHENETLCKIKRIKGMTLPVLTE